MEFGLGRHGQGRRLSVIKHRPQTPDVSATRRLLEWSLVSAVVLVLVLVFNWHMRTLQGQTERVTVQTTLGALRTALVIDYLHRTVTPGVPADASPVALQSNPFELLERQPVNYLGPMTAQQAASAPPGNWVFDPECVCVGYTPLNPHLFESPSGSLMPWYAVRGIATLGPLQLTAQEAYRWQGQLLN